MRTKSLAIALAGALCAACSSTTPEPTKDATPPSIVAAPIRVADTAEGAVSYRSIGSGPPLLLIIGYHNSMDEWPPAFVDALARHLRVITFDNAGVGQTSSLRGTLSISAMADQTDSFIQAMHLGQLDILGWSMGGMIAQALTVLHPADVRRLVLCATAPGNGQATGPSPAAAEALLHPDQGSGMAPLLFPPDHRAKQLPAYLAQIGQYSHPYRAPAVMARAQLSASASWISGKDPAGAGIDRIAAPTLIGGGQDDEFFPVANSTVLHKTIPRSQLVVYPDAGHGFLFQDADAWTSKIDAFLGTNG